MKLSIAMATYNGAKYLPAQLESFLQQERLPDELVVSDDCSSDSTLDLLAAFREEAPFQVTLLRNERNLGVDANFASALQACTGDLIFISDQDDYWFKEKIAAIERMFAGDPQLQLVVNDQRIADEHLNPSDYTTLQNFRKTFASDEAFGNGCCLSFRRSWLDFVLPIPSDTFNYDLWINTLATLLKVRGVYDQPLQLYRRHGGNVSNSVAFEMREVSRSDYFAQDIGEDHRDLWARQIDNMGVYAGRIGERRQVLLRMIHEETIEDALGEIEDRAQALSIRTRIRSASRLGRVPLVTHMLLQRRYRHFSGLRSAARDLMLK